MAITKTKFHSSVNKTKFKITADAAAATTTLALKTAITIALPGTSTFDAETGTIVRSTGSWITDGVTIGSVLVIAGTVNNNGVFIVRSVTADTVTIESGTSVAKNVLVDEAVAATYANSYKSEFLHYGQVFNTATPKVNIAEMSYTCNAGGKITLTRNAVVTHALFGSLIGFHAPSNEENASDVVVLFDTTAGGTLVLELSKVEGFSSVNPSALPY